MITIGCKGKFTEWLTDDGLLRIEGWARSGLIDAQIAKNIGITPQTLCEWVRKFPSFSDALKRGKKPVDDEVESALLKRALGYQYEETITEIEEVPTGRITDDGKPIVKQVKHIRKVQKTAIPDTTAQIFWLKNRRPDRWRDKPITVEDTGTIEKLDKLLEVAWNAAHE